MEIKKKVFNFHFNETGVTPALIHIWRVNFLLTPHIYNHSKVEFERNRGFDFSQKYFYQNW